MEAVPHGGAGPGGRVRRADRGGRESDHGGLAMDIGTLLLTLGLAYGFGVLWYDLLPGQLPGRAWRVAAYPFLGMYVAQALFARSSPGDPAFGGVHLVTATAGSLVAVLVDWIVTRARRPELVPSLEPPIDDGRDLRPAAPAAAA